MINKKKKIAFNNAPKPVNFNWRCNSFLSNLRIVFIALIIWFVWIFYHIIEWCDLRFFRSSVTDKLVNGVIAITWVFLSTKSIFVLSFSCFGFIERYVKIYASLFRERNATEKPKKVCEIVQFDGPSHNQSISNPIKQTET